MVRRVVIVLATIIGKEIIAAKQTIVLQSDHQPAFNAIITEVDNDLFWVNLPKEGNQVLVLQQNQRIKVGITLPDGFYSTETTVKILGDNSNKFYGLVIPEQFSDNQERRFTRAHHSTNVLFESGNLKAQTAAVNFSAGGVMVYLVPKLEKILKAGNPVKARLVIDNLPFNLEVRLTWRKTYANIPFAGFEFPSITPREQSALALLSVRHTDKNKES